MRSQSLLVTILSGFMIFTMALFISCASSGRVQEDAFPSSGEGDESVAEAETQEGGSSDEGSLLTDEETEDKEDGELSFLDEEKQEAEEGDGAKEEESGDDKEFSTLMDETPQQEGQAENLSNDELMAVGTAPKAEAQLEGEGEDEEEMEKESEDEEGDELAWDKESSETTDAAVPGLEPEVAATDSNLQKETFSTPSFEVASTPAYNAISTAPYRKSVVPVIDKMAFEKNGTSLNRFYFTRKGDTPESVSKLLYGKPDHADDLTQWNKPASKWSAGQVVYYSSPMDPNDSQMRSFYQEREVVPEPYTLKSGDWLSTLASNRYGSIHSWKEIAVINGLNSPDQIRVGQQLALYPGSLTEYAYEPPAPKPVPVVKTPPPTQVQTPPSAIAKNQVSPNHMDHGATDLDSADTQLTPPSPPVIKRPDPVKRSAPSTQSEPDIAKLIEQNMFFLAIGGVILLLLLSLVVVNKRRRSRRDEFEDEFSTRQQGKR